MKKSLKDIEMVFLVTRSRSGSTLLQNILNAHPNISAPIESKFILHLKTKYYNVTNWDDKTINEFANDLFTNRKIRLFWNIKPNDILSLFQKYTVNSFADACKLVYLSFPSVNEPENIKVIVDKNPAYARFVNELKEVFPSAKFIHLIRDPRAVINSQIKAFNKKSVYNLAYLWVSLNKNIIDSCKANQKNYIKIKYENLVSQPVEEIKNLLHFLSLNYDARLLESHKSIKSVIEKSNFYSLPHHINTGNPINTKSLNLWESELSEKRIRIINAICYQFAEQNNYTLPSQQLSFFESLIYSISKAKMRFVNFSMKTLFKLPLSLRKLIYAIVSFFYDKKYVK